VIAALWAGFLRLLPAMLASVAILAAVWAMARAVPEGLEATWFRRRVRRFQRKLREMRP